MHDLLMDNWFKDIIVLLTVWLGGQIIAEIIKVKIRKGITYHRQDDLLFSEFSDKFLKMFEEHIKSQQMILDAIVGNKNLLMEQKMIATESRDIIKKHSDSCDDCKAIIKGIDRAMIHLKGGS